MWGEGSIFHFSEIVGGFSLSQDSEALEDLVSRMKKDLVSRMKNDRGFYCHFTEKA